MATIQQVGKAAADLGVTLNYDPGSGNLDAWSPRGFAFKATGCHCIAHHFERGPWRSESLEEMLDDLSYGLEQCLAEDCDICIEPDLMSRVEFEIDGETLEGEILGEAIQGDEWAFWLVTCDKGPRAGESFNIPKSDVRGVV